MAAALVPPTALLVPGASGASPVLGVERAAAVAAATAVRAARPDVVVVVVEGRAARHLTGRLQPSLAAAGVDDARLGWTPRASYGRGRATVVAEVGGAVGLLLLDRAGWTGQTEVAVVGPADPDELHALGVRLVDGREAALLLVGGLSARRGPDGPLDTDERAGVVDDAAVSDLADLGPAARARLAAVPAQLAAELAISAWAPWQVLVGATDGREGPPAPAPSAVRHQLSVPFGATYATFSWRWR